MFLAASLALLGAGCAVGPLNVEASSGAAPTQTGTAATTAAVSQAGATLPSTPSGQVVLPTAPASLTPAPAAATATPAVLAMPTATHAFAAIPVSSLLYLSENRLMRWDRRTTHSEMLADGVTAFSAADDGRSVAYTQVEGMAANGLLRYRLSHLDLLTLDRTPVLTQSPPLRLFALAPNGRYIAYIPEVEGQPVYVTGPDLPTPLRLGACAGDQTGFCDRLAWSPKADSLAWSNAAGVWVAGLDGEPARNTHPPAASVIDPKGQSVSLPVHFTQLEWSPVGRFLLAKVRPLHSNVTWYAILDATNGRVASVMQAYSQNPGMTQVSFLPDGSLLLTQASDPATRRPPTVTIIRVLATRPQLLAIDKVFKLTSSEFPMLDSSRKTIPVHMLDWPGYPVKGYLPIGVLVQGADAAPALFKLELQYGRLEKLLQLPAGVNLVIWSPDGSGGLLVGGGDKLSFLSLDKAQVYPLTPTFGEDAHAFVWLAPNP